MTSTTELCECGCGAVILPTDNHPFFKRYVCSALWQASVALPEDRQVVWRARQRYMSELWLAERWEDTQDFYPIAEDLMISSANLALSDAGSCSLFAPDELEDAMRVLVYRLWRNTQGSWAWSRDLVPDWAVVRQRKARAATLAVVG